MKNIIAILPIILCVSGCYASQRDSIDAKYIRKIEYLDAKCMVGENKDIIAKADYCKDQYFETKELYFKEVDKDHDQEIVARNRKILATVIVVTSVAAVSVVAAAVATKGFQ